MGSISAAYRRYRLCCNAFSSRDAEIAERLNPSCLANFSISCFITGFTQDVTFTALFLEMCLFCVRGVFLFKVSALVCFWSGAGCGEAGEAGGGAGLSCPTP